MRLVAATALCLAVCRLPAAERAALDQLPQGALQSAFEILRRDYIRRDELTFEELNRAALQGLLERLRFGAQIVPADQVEAKVEPHVHTEFLAPDIAYIRPASFATGEAAMFEAGMKHIVDWRARHLVIDLRETSAPGMFEEAAQMLQAFVPMGGLIFKMKQMGADTAELFVSKTTPLWRDSLVVLVDEDTNNAAEAFAACLQHRGLAFVMGTRTRGAAVRYSETPLDEKTRLRYASAELLLPDDSTVFKRGVTPDFALTADRKEKLAVFKGSRDGGMKPFITDRVRPRYDEKALVSGTNPELDDYVRRSKGKPLPGDGGQVRDELTQRALDLLLGAGFVAKKNLALPPVAPPPPSSEIQAPKALPANP